MVWWNIVHELSSLEAGFDKLAGDVDYEALVAKGAEYALAGSLDDSLNVILRGEPNPDREVKYLAAVNAAGVCTDRPGATTQLIYRRIA